MSKKRTCLCCGREYKYCPTCSADSGKPKWMSEFDTEVCKDLFNAVSAVGMGADKNVIEKVIRKYKIKDYSIYKESIKNALEQVAAIEENRLKKARGKKAEVDEFPLEEKKDIELENADEISE